MAQPVFRHTKWDYTVRDLKVDVDTGRYMWGDARFGELGDDGWELVAIVPLPQADPKGTFAQTVAQAVFKRPQL